MIFLKRARTRYTLHRYAIKHKLWVAVTSQLQVLQGMSSVEKAHLRELSTLFVHEKNILCMKKTSSVRRIFNLPRKCE